MFFAGINESNGNYPKELFLLPFDSSQRTEYWVNENRFMSKTKLTRVY
jgi:hypothetical protein